MVTIAELGAISRSNEIDLPTDRALLDLKMKNLTEDKTRVGHALNSRDGEPFTSMILLPGHAPLRDGVDENVLSLAELGKDEHWVLQPFQQGNGEPHCYIEHISVAIDIALRNPDALIMISGGFTRHDTHCSEANSYYRILCKIVHERFFNPKSPEYNVDIGLNIIRRAVREQQAVDSLDNIEQSERLFAHIMGNAPEAVEIIGWEFKRDRFEFHIETLGQEGRIQYIGVNNPADAEGARKGDAHALAEFHADPHAEGGELHQKRIARNPYGLAHLY